MSLLVMKFGGTSVGSATRIRQAAEIICAARREHAIVVVVSAMAGVTDLIVESTAKASVGDKGALEACLERLEELHREVICELFCGSTAEVLAQQCASVMRELRDLCSGLLMFRSSTPQVLDSALAIGERLSVSLLAGYLAGLGVDARPFDARQFLITDDNFGDATPDMTATSERSRQVLTPAIAAGAVPVVTGFCGATAAGHSTTLGRGGSDYSATILGAALGCDEIWIWTDVDGVMSADPRLCRDATTLSEITFAEAIEMSYYGAKVIHRKAIRPAMDSRIPVLIKNSFRPDAAGTRIVATAERNGRAVKAVTGIMPTALVTLNLRNFGHFEDLFGRLFLALGHERIDVLFSTHSSSENALGLLFREQDLERALSVIERAFRTEIKHSIVAPVVVQRDVAVIAVVGETMRGKCGVLARLFSSVAACGVSVIAVAQGASELNICFAVPQASAQRVIASVHDEFAEGRSQSQGEYNVENEQEPNYGSRCCA